MGTSDPARWCAPNNSDLDHFFGYFFGFGFTTTPTVLPLASSQKQGQPPHSSAAVRTHPLTQPKSRAVVHCMLAPTAANTQQHQAALAAAAACLAGAAVLLAASYSSFHRSQHTPPVQQHDNNSWWRSLWASLLQGRGSQKHVAPAVVHGVAGAIGNTPLIRIASLSDATGCEILGKAEFLNPGGSVKDRVALRIIQEALVS